MVFIYWHIHSIESVSFEKKGLFRITLVRPGFIWKVLFVIKHGTI